MKLGQAVRDDLAALRLILPMIETARSRTVVTDTAMLRRLLDTIEAQQAALEILDAFVQWTAQLDDPANPEHATVTLIQIAERAQGVAEA